MKTSAQETPKQNRFKQAEQNEIKGDQHLQKELQRKQLLMQPERLTESTPRKTSSKKSKKPSNKPNAKKVTSKSTNSRT